MSASEGRKVGGAKGLTVELAIEYYGRTKRSTVQKLESEKLYILNAKTLVIESSVITVLKRSLSSVEMRRPPLFIFGQVLMS